MRDNQKPHKITMTSPDEAEATVLAPARQIRIEISVDAGRISEDDLQWLHQRVRARVEQDLWRAFTGAAAPTGPVSGATHTTILDAQHVGSMLFWRMYGLTPAEQESLALLSSVERLAAEVAAWGIVVGPASRAVISNYRALMHAIASIVGYLTSTSGFTAREAIALVRDDLRGLEQCWLPAVARAAEAYMRGNPDAR